MSNLCNSSFTLGVRDALSQEILWSDCSFFAVSLENDTWCCWKEERELINFVPALQHGISSLVTATVFLRISTFSLHHPHPFLGCGSTQRQREANCHFWIYTWVSGTTRDVALLTQANNLPIRPRSLPSDKHDKKPTTCPVVCSNKGLHCATLISFILCIKLTAGGKAVNDDADWLLIINVYHTKEM